MHYRERPPSASLRRFVKCVWQLRTGNSGPAAPADPPVERVLPDGCLEWVFHFANPFHQIVGSARHRQSTALVVGASTGAILLEPSPVADVLGVRFHPGGALPFLRAPAHEFTDRIIPLDDLGDRGLSRLWGDLQAVTSEARMGAIEAFLLRRCAERRAPSGALVAVESLLQGGRSVQEVAAASGMGVRRLQRWFRQEVGVGPKQLSRIGRLQRSLPLLADARRKISHVALDAGYADQAHFGREFRQLSGITPARFRAETHPLSDALTGLGEEGQA